MTKEKIFEVTKGGLSILVELFPECAAVEGKKKHFKMRPENSASAMMIRDKEGTYFVTDFGGDSKKRNAIDWYMEERKVDFNTAIRELSKQYGVVPNGSSGRAKITETIYDSSAPHVILGKTREVTDDECKLWGNHVTPKVLALYKISFLESYTIQKDSRERGKKAYVISATKYFPMFVIDYGEYQKIYKPKEPEKKNRFMVAGQKPSTYICGLDQLEKAFFNLGTDDDGEQILHKRVIICTGESDAINIAAVGENVIWMNSESQVMRGDQYKEIAAMVDDVYYCGDLDPTGKKAAHKICLEFMGIRRIDLPEELTFHTDTRGKSCKDAKDFFKYYSEYDWSQLLRIAYPYRFWDTVVKRNKEGDVQSITNKFNTAFALNFLAHCGFYRLEMPNTKEGFIFIRIENNIVSEITAKDIKTFVNTFVKQKRLHVNIINMVLNTTKLSEASLSNLPYATPDFRKAEHDRQYWFFENRVWEITKKGIQEYKAGGIERHVWKEDIIAPRIKNKEQHNVKPLPDPFEVKFVDDKWEVQINDWDNPFLQFAVNCSRIHWQNEFKTAGVDQSLKNVELKAKGLNTLSGKNLSAEEVNEQHTNFANKVHALGHLMHSFKDPSKPWAVWSMDGTISEMYESHGGSGKSLLIKAARYFTKTEVLQGRNKHLTENQFVLGNVTKHHELLYIEDAHLNFDFDFFFSCITDDFAVNAKFGKPFVLEFDDSPKMAITSNFPLRTQDSSSLRRIYYMVNSDYYHQSGTIHNKTKDPSQDLGFNLFQDFTPHQWNQFFNFMACCIKTSLSFHRINAPEGNIGKRSQRAKMGESFFDWANRNLKDAINYEGLKYKQDESDLVVAKDGYKLLLRKEARDEYIKENTKSITAQGFKIKIEAWCEFYNLQMNPEGHPKVSSEGRCNIKIDGKTSEAFVIVSNDAAAAAIDALEQLPETDEFGEL